MKLKNILKQVIKENKDNILFTSRHNDKTRKVIGHPEATQKPLSDITWVDVEGLSVPSGYPGNGQKTRMNHISSFEPWKAKMMEHWGNLILTIDKNNSIWYKKCQVANTPNPENQEWNKLDKSVGQSIAQDYQSRSGKYTGD